MKITVLTFLVKNRYNRSSNLKVSKNDPHVS